MDAEATEPAATVAAHPQRSHERTKLSERIALVRAGPDHEEALPSCTVAHPAPPAVLMPLQHPVDDTAPTRRGGES